MHFRYFWQIQIQKFLNIFSLSNCHCCHKKISSDKYKYICQDCYEKIRIENASAKYKKTFIRENEKLRIRYFFKYKNEIRELIKAYKFTKPYLAHLLAKFLLERQFFDLDFIEEKTFFCSIPMHARKLKEKGFDHCKLLLQEILREKKLGDKVLNFLIREKDTPALYDKGLLERICILKNVFGINKELIKNIPEKSKLIIFDDISTTGSTLYEAYKTLRSTCCFSKIDLFSFSAND
jgi:competence protein ComFC